MFFSLQFYLCMAVRLSCMLLNNYRSDPKKKHKNLKYSLQCTPIISYPRDLAMHLTHGHVRARPVRKDSKSLLRHAACVLQDLRILRDLEPRVDPSHAPKHSSLFDSELMELSLSHALLLGYRIKTKATGHHGTSFKEPRNPRKKYPNTQQPNIQYNNLLRRSRFSSKSQVIALHTEAPRATTDVVARGEPHERRLALVPP
jgi:hypothetical protein